MFYTLSLLLALFILPAKHLQAMTLSDKILASHEFSLNIRYPIASVNQVFKDNILLTIAYTTHAKINPKSIDWHKLELPATYSFSLQPGQTFAFHSDVLPQYSGKVTKTSNSNFSLSEGFKSDGYLPGDGVCHLASLMYWVASDAGLQTLAPTRHNFAPIPQIPPLYGTAIYDTGTKGSYTSEVQNLYITNNKNKTVTFDFIYNGQNLTVDAVE